MKPLDYEITIRIKAQQAKERRYERLDYLWTTIFCFMCVAFGVLMWLFA